jgi:sulfonate transport system permease protein
VPFVILAAVWTLLGRDPERARFFVSGRVLGRALVEVVRSGELGAHVLASVGRAGAALALGSLAGMAVGVALGASRPLDRAFGPTLHAFRQIPYLGLAPLLGLWLGTGDAAKLTLATLAVFYPLVLAVHAGVREIDRRHLEVARVLALSRVQVLRRVILPSVAPFVVTGLSQGVAFAWIATIGSEILLVAGNGIGTFLQTAAAAARADLVLIGVLVVASLGVLFDRGVRRVSARYMPWVEAR